jgi:hypothetical protein
MSKVRGAVGEVVFRKGMNAKKKRGAGEKVVFI